MRRHTSLLVGPLLFIAAGCITSTDPVWDDGHVLLDARVEGSFENTREGKKDGSTWLIRPSADGKKNYDVFVYDGNTITELVGTLFRLDKTIFFDLFPLRDSGMRHGNGAPSVSEVIHGAMYDPRHVIWKVELSDTNVTYWVPFGNGTSAAAKKAPALKAKRNNNALVVMLPDSKPEAQKYLRQFADDPEVFNYRGQLVKNETQTKR